MTTEYTLMEGSAADYQSKKASLSQCVVPRLMNTDESLDQTTRNEIINEFGRKLSKSGYSKYQIHEIIEGGVISYERRKKETRRDRPQGPKRHPRGVFSVNL